MTIQDFIEAFCGPDRTEHETITELDIDCITTLQCQMHDMIVERQIATGTDSEGQPVFDVTALEFDLSEAAGLMWSRHLEQVNDKIDLGGDLQAAVDQVITMVQRGFSDEPTRVQVAELCARTIGNGHHYTDAAVLEDGPAEATA